MSGEACRAVGRGLVVRQWGEASSMKPNTAKNNPGLNWGSQERRCLSSKHRPFAFVLSGVVGPRPKSSKLPIFSTPWQWPKEPQGGSLVPSGEALVILRPQYLLILACVLRSLWKLRDEHDELSAPSSCLARGFHFKQSHMPPHGVSLQLSKAGVHVFSLGCGLRMHIHTYI